MLPLVSGGWGMTPMTLAEHGYPKPAWWGRGAGKVLIDYSGIKGILGGVGGLWGHRMVWGGEFLR